MSNIITRFTIPAAVVAAAAFSLAGSPSESAAGANVAAGQSARWVTAAYTVPVVIPNDGGGRSPSPTPHQHHGHHIHHVHHVHHVDHVAHRVHG